MCRMKLNIFTILYIFMTPGGQLGGVSIAPVTRLVSEKWIGDHFRGSFQHLSRNLSWLHAWLSSSRVAETQDFSRNVNL